APAFGVRAMRVDGGYRLTGRWGYNSGAPNADWIAAAAPIFDGDQPRVGESGPEMVVAFVPPSAVEIIDTWYVTGLRATGTQDLRIDNVYVSDEMTGLASMQQGVWAVRERALNRFQFFSLVGMVQ